MWKFRATGVGLLIGSIVLLALTSTTNWVQGLNDGVTEPGKIINSAGSVAVDVMGLLFCGMAVGVCIGIRRWGWAVVFSLGLVLSALWSGYSVYSFRASEQVSASTTREIANSRIEEADKLAKAAATKTLDAATGSRYRSVRQDFIAANQEAIKSFRDAEVKVIVPPDAGSASFARGIGWKLEDVQTAKAVFFSVLIIFLKMIGFPGAGFLLSWRPEETDRRISGSKKGGSGEGGGSDPEVKSSEKSEPSHRETIVALPGNVTPIRATVSPSLQSRSIAEILAAHPSVSQSALAALSGKSPATVSRDLKRLEGRGKIDRKRKGREVLVSLRRHGGLHAVGL